ncbi:UNVERIFIED_CONTAM: hypothetical protein Sradi_1326200 [Sesamum radiatum]|uniref:Uncharacterized protein n=1 Tax=Sesamum radiatum TaxID=300843 RepID=A0AAW2UQD9_SESRA
MTKRKRCRRDLNQLLRSSGQQSGTSKVMQFPHVMLSGPASKPRAPGTLCFNGADQLWCALLELFMLQVQCCLCLD